MRMKKCKRWGKIAFEEKKKIAADFLAPFLYSEAELNEVVAEIDRSISICLSQHRKGS